MVHLMGQEIWYMHARARTHTHTHTHARTRTHAHTHTHICSNTITVLTTHRYILMDYFNNCNFNKNELMRSLMIV